MVPVLNRRNYLRAVAVDIGFASYSDPAELQPIKLEIGETRAMTVALDFAVDIASTMV
jgi:hypothetical protein